MESKPQKIGGPSEASFSAQIKNPLHTSERVCELVGEIYAAHDLRPRRLHIGPREVLSFKQQRLSLGFRQRIGEAISKIQFGWVAARFAEVAIGLTRYASLRFGDRLNRDLRFLDQFIKTAAGNRIFAAIKIGR